MLHIQAFNGQSRGRSVYNENTIRDAASMADVKLTDPYVVGKHIAFAGTCRVSNVTERAFTVSLMTNQPLDITLKCDNREWRDLAGGLLHYFDIYGLRPNGTYPIEIFSTNAKLAIMQGRTGPELPLRAPDPIYGTVRVGEAGTRSLIYFHRTSRHFGSQLASRITEENGEWDGDLNLRMASLQRFL